MTSLTNAKCQSPKLKPGRYSDGGGLYLYVRPSGRRSWVLRIAIDGRRRDIGLGPFPDLSLSVARKLAAEHRAAVAEGRNPLTEKRRDGVPTFREAAERTYETHKSSWRNGKHTKSWWQSLERHVFPKLGDTRLDRISKRDVLTVLDPIWRTRPETARRVRRRIHATLEWALDHEHVERNVAAEIGRFALPPQPKVKAHLRALPYADVADALETVDASKASLPAKLCFRFLVLTAARSGEARGATWDEIHMEARTWNIPAQRMKAAKAHTVPLSDSSIDVLKQAWPLSSGQGLIFPSSLKHGRPMSDMTLMNLLRNIGLAEDTTVHGFRTSFRVWAEECTSSSHSAKELSLAHTVGNSVEQAYMRSDMLIERRQLMDAWADYLAV